MDTERTPINSPRRTIALVLAGGRGSRLHALTDRRAKPAVYFGGKFRIVDFALSNCLNSGVRRIGVVTQYKSHSLLRHLQRGWSFLRNEFNEFIDLLPAQQRIDETSLVPGHGRRGVPEPGHPERGAPRVHPGAGRRPHLQDGLRQPDRRPRGAGRALHRGLHRSAAGRGQRLRRDGHRRAAAHRPLRRKAGPPAPMPGRPGPWRWPAWASTCSTPTTCTRP